MSVLDELRNVLTHHRRHASEQTNQGTVHLIDDHLARLENAVIGDPAHWDAAAHKVLGELYGALNAPAEAAPTTAAIDLKVDGGVVDRQLVDLQRQGGVQSAPAEPEQPHVDDEHEHPDGAV